MIDLFCQFHASIVNELGDIVNTSVFPSIDNDLELERTMICSKAVGARPLLDSISAFFRQCIDCLQLYVASCWFDSYLDKRSSSMQVWRQTKEFVQNILSLQHIQTDISHINDVFSLHSIKTMCGCASRCFRSLICEFGAVIAKKTKNRLIRLAVIVLQMVSTRCSCSYKQVIIEWNKRESIDLAYTPC